MRFTWPAAAGLGLGMLAGFAVALVRPRSPAQPQDPDAAPSPGTAAARRPRPPRRVIDATTPDARAGSEAGSDISGRVI
jgi:hypothetical protein